MQIKKILNLFYRFVKGEIMEKIEEKVDLDAVHVAINEGMAVCSLMRGYSDDDDLGAEAVRALGLQLQEKFQEISLSLGL